jgi:hypothetical protein
MEWGELSEEKGANLANVSFFVEGFVAIRQRFFWLSSVTGAEVSKDANVELSVSPLSPPSKHHQAAKRCSR